MRTGSPTPGAGAVAMGVCRAIAAPLHTADQDHDVWRRQSLGDVQRIDNNKRLGREHDVGSTDQQHPDQPFVWRSQSLAERRRIELLLRRSGQQGRDDQRRDGHEIGHQPECRAVASADANWERGDKLPLCWSWELTSNPEWF